MYLAEYSTVALIFLASLSSAMIALWISLRDPSRHRTPARKLLEGSEKSLVFIFDDESLIDATVPAQALLKTVPHAKTDWQRLLAVLCARFPTLKSDLTDLAQSGRKTLIAEGADDPTIIVAEWWDDLVRIELLNPEETTPEIPVDRECPDRDGGRAIAAARRCRKRAVPVMAANQRRRRDVGPIPPISTARTSFAPMRNTPLGRRRACSTP